MKREPMSTTVVPMMPWLFSVSRQAGTPQVRKKLRDEASYQRKKLGKKTMPAGSQSPNSTLTGYTTTLDMLTPEWVERTSEAAGVMRRRGESLTVERKIADDVYRQLCKFLSLAETFGEGDRCRQRLLDFFRQLVQQRRQEQARCNRHHAHAELGEVARERQGQRGDAAFRRRIGGLTDLAVVGGNGSSRDDYAALAVFQRLLRDHLCCGKADHVEGADQIDVDDAAEIFQRHGDTVFADQAFGAADAGAVDQDTCRAVCGTCGSERSFDAGGVGDVAGCGVAAYFFCQRLRAFNVHIEDGHARTSLRQLTHHFGAESGSAAGDQCCLPL